MAHKLYGSQIYICYIYMSSEAYTKKRKQAEEEGAIIFTIARMNPPTTGHMKVIRDMIEKALEVGQEKVYILLSHTTGKRTDPLMCKEKKELLLNGMIEKVKQSLEANVDVEVICGDEPLSPQCGNRWITSQLCHIMQQYDTSRLNLYLFVGQDRIDDGGYGWIGGVFNKPDAPMKIQLIITGISRPSGAISATYMRDLAMHGQKEEFMEKEMEAGLSAADAEMLYSTLKTRLAELPEPSIKKSRTSKKGGRKTKRKNKKKHTVKYRK
jgi:hypothetical protein